MSDDEKKKRPNARFIGHETRFKSGENGFQKTTGLKNPHSIRYNLRRLMAEPIDFTDEETINKSIKRMLGQGRGRKKKNVTPAANFLAVRAVEKVIKKMETQAFINLIDQVDGKLVQPVDLDPEKEAPEEFISVEEAAAAYTDFMKR